MGNNNLILAGVTAGGTDGTALAWFGATDATAPTSAILPVTPQASAGWYDGGMITEDGIAAKFTQSTKKIKAYGSNQVQRTLVTEEETSFDIMFLETNATSTAVWTRVALDSYTPDANGAWALTHSTYSKVLYSVIFDIVDADNHMRIYCPEVEVTDRKERKVAAGEAITWGVTLTAYPDASGNVAYEWLIMDALAA